MERNTLMAVILSIAFFDKSELKNLSLKVQQMKMQQTTNIWGQAERRIKVCSEIQIIQFSVAYVAVWLPILISNPG